MWDGEKFLEQVIAVPVTERDMFEYADALPKLRNAEAPTFDVRALWLAERHGGDPLKIFAVELRMLAVARVLMHLEAAGESFKNARVPGRSERDVAFSVAATEPLVFGNGSARFDTVSFIDRMRSLYQSS